MGVAARRILLFSTVIALTATSGCIGWITGSSGFGETWHLDMVGATELQERGLTGAGVQVAVIDTGVDQAHPEFAGVPIRWLDIVNNRKAPYDNHGHGTHVAGVIVAQGDWHTWLSGFELRGVAPGVTLIAVKAIAYDGKGDETNVARGVITALENGADIIVLSLGGGNLPALGSATEHAVEKALDAGVFVVAAAGNSPQDGDGCRVTSPANVEGVIAVGAVGRDGKVAAFSCRGDDSPVTLERDPHRKPELVAPGVDILSGWADGKYVQASGTSQAAPVVAGVLALALEEHPEFRRDSRDRVLQVKELLMTTAKKVGPLEGLPKNAHDPAYGYGLVDGPALLRALG